MSWGDRIKPFRMSKAITGWLVDQGNVHRAQQKVVRAGAKRFLTALNHRINVSALARAIEVGGMAAIEQAVALDDFQLRFLESEDATLREGLREGADTAAARFPKSLEDAARQVAVTAPETPYSLDWIAAHSAELVREVSSEMMLSLRATVEYGASRGLHPRATAKLINDGTLGLTQNQSMSVLRYRQQLESQGTPQARIDDLVGRKYKRKVKQRAETIARTEGSRSVNQGRQAHWNEMAEQGHIDASQVKRIWITSRDERVSDICEPLDGERVGLDEEFPGGYFAPPDTHPNCRCTVSLIFE